MSKNLIPIIADCLGVRIGEEFSINGEGRFRFSETQLESYGFYLLRWERSDLSFNKLYEAIIKKIPYEPVLGEIYWSYITLAGKWEIKKFYWEDDIMDNFAKHAGCIFRTEAEAIAALPVKYKELTGKEWKE